MIRSGFRTTALVAGLTLLTFLPVSARDIVRGSCVCTSYEPGTRFEFECWAPDGLGDGEGALYVFMEYGAQTGLAVLQSLMERGEIPSGLCLFLTPGRQPVGEYLSAKSYYLRAEEYDQPGSEYPNAIAEEIVPAAERCLGLRVSRNPDLHFIAGVSSGAHAAFNACWYRNDFFRRCFLSSPTFSNIRQGNQIIPLVRKSETRPMRIWLSVGSFEPDYFFGDSYYVALDAASAFRASGYDVHVDRFLGEGHGARYWTPDYTGKVLTWLFRGWRKETAVVTPGNPLRVRNFIEKGRGWEPCEFKMPPASRVCRSPDGCRLWSVSPTNRFVMSEFVDSKGNSSRRLRLAPLELAWNVSQPGGFALACCADGRLLVATELGVQGVVPFGLTDIVLPLPGDLPCDNVALVGRNLYAASGNKVFVRPVAVSAADPLVVSPHTAPGYDDGFWYAREHASAEGLEDLLGSYLVGGRIAGAVSVLSDADYHESYVCVGWSDRDRGTPKNIKMSPDTLFAVFSMTKTFTGVALMCAIDEGLLSLDDEVRKYLPEFADMRMKDASSPKRPLTIRDMITHVSGVRFDLPIANRDLPLREVARRVAAAPLETQPGEVFSYGSSTFDVAAACLEVAAGCSYEAYLSAHVLDPLGMKDTTFNPTEEQISRLAKAYPSDDGPRRPATDYSLPHLQFPKKGPVCPATGGGLFSTPRDMIRFSQMLAHHGAWKDVTIVSRSTFDEVFAVKQTPSAVSLPYSCGAWIYGDWIGHEGAFRTDQRANLRTGQSRVFFISTENRAGSAFFNLKKEWHLEADKIQGTPETIFGH